MNGPKMGWDTGWKPGIQSIPAIAPGYKKQTYPKGAVISVGEKLYISNTAIGTPEDFNKDHWDETDVMSCISDVGEGGKIAVFDVSPAQGKPYPTFSQIYSEVTAGRTVALRVVNYNGSSDSPADYYYLHNYRAAPSSHSYTFSNGMKTKSVTSLDVWSEVDVAYGLYDGGSKTEADLVEGELAIASTNSLTRLTLTTVQTLTVLANDGVPNFALEIDNTGNSNDVTVTVQDSTGTTTLNASVAGGDTVGAGKYVQLTCVGSCWTLAEFTVPTP
jgi:hypothetical protein